MADAIPIFRPKNLHAQIVDKIGELIVSGHYAAGEKLPVEAEFGARYGVSRSVMREVTKILMAKGLVYSRPRVGTVVQHQRHWNMLDRDVLNWTINVLPEAEFLDMLFDARMAIEPGAARLAAEEASDEDLQRIQQAYTDMEAAESPEELLEPDIRFHMAIVDASHNALLRHVVRALHTALSVSIKLTSRHPETHALSLPRHQAVMQALLNRDAEAAEQATIRLLQESQDDFRVMPAAKSGQH